MTVLFDLCPGQTGTAGCRRVRGGRFGDRTEMKAEPRLSSPATCLPPDSAHGLLGLWLLRWFNIIFFKKISFIEF